MAISKSKTVTVPPKKQQALATVSDNALFAADGGVGFDEGVDAGAYAIPFLSILQALSPQVQRGKPEQIPGAQPGMLFNTVTKELFETVQVSVLRRTHTFCVWTPRDDGGGFIGEYEATDKAVTEFNAIKPDDKGRRFNALGQEVTEHRNFYCQLIQEGRADQPAVISMSRSQLKAAREWNSNLAMRSVRVGEAQQPVALSEIWEVGTTLRTKGENSWFMYTVKHVARHSDPALYQQVREAVTFAKEHKVAARTAEVPSDEI